jgi:nicotinamidase-related amidase
MNISHLVPSPSLSALVVIDIQEKLSNAMPSDALELVVKGTKALAALAREFSFPILLTEQYPRGLGSTLPGLHEALVDIQPIQKMAFSCWGELAFQQALTATRASDILLCGMETHVCVFQTALDLLAAGKRVFLPADALCSRSPENRSLALDLLRQAGAVVGCSEMFIFQMLREAGSERFKRLSRLVR